MSETRSSFPSVRTLNERCYLAAMGRLHGKYMCCHYTQGGTQQDARFTRARTRKGILEVKLLLASGEDTWVTPTDIFER